MNFVCHFNEPMKIVCLSLIHPVPAVDQGSFDHFELLPGNHWQSRLEVFDNVILELSVAESDDRGDDVVVSIWGSKLNRMYILSPRYSRAVG